MLQPQKIFLGTPMQVTFY